jgi:hypothetical protein
MDNVTHSPFAALTMIVAPAMLTNASCVLAMSTINRMLRTRERMRELLAESREESNRSADEIARAARQVDRVERQAMLLMGAIASIYVALGSFALATLVSLIGAAFASIADEFVYRMLAATGFVLGVVGVCGLVFGCARLFRATQLSLANIREEAQEIRERRARRSG